LGVRSVKFVRSERTFSAACYRVSGEGMRRGLTGSSARRNHRPRRRSGSRRPPLSDSGAAVHVVQRRVRTTTGSGRGGSAGDDTEWPQKTHVGSQMVDIAPQLLQCPALMMKVSLLARKDPFPGPAVMFLNFTVAHVLGGALLCNGQDGAREAGTEFEGQVTNVSIQAI